MSHITTSPYSNEKTYTKEPLSTFAHILKTCFCHVRAIILFQFKRKYISISLSISLLLSLFFSNISFWQFLPQYAFYVSAHFSLTFSYYLSFCLPSILFLSKSFTFLLFFFFRQYVLLISIQRILFHSENFSQNWPVCLFLTVELLFSFLVFKSFLHTWRYISLLLWDRPFNSLILNIFLF